MTTDKTCTVIGLIKVDKNRQKCWKHQLLSPVLARRHRFGFLTWGLVRIVWLWVRNPSSGVPGDMEVLEFGYPDWNNILSTWQPTVFTMSHQPAIITSRIPDLWTFFIAPFLQLLHYTNDKRTRRLNIILLSIIVCHISTFWRLS